MADGIAAASSVFPATDPARAGAAAAQGTAQPAKAPNTPQGTGPAAASGDSVTLSPEAKREVAKLQSRDADVRAHEAAHIGAGGSLVTSGATFTYERGPDGRMYAVGGEVSIDTSPVRGNPQATITKAAQIEAAALAPVDPSAQDEAVAAQAAAMSAQAAAQLASQSGKASAGSTGGSATGAAQAGASAGTNGQANATAAPGALEAQAQTAGKTADQAIAAITGAARRPGATGEPRTSQTGTVATRSTDEQTTVPSQAIAPINDQAARVRAYGRPPENQTGSQFSAYA